jgi:tRNA pseudouridine38-40 synthase
LPIVRIRIDLAYDGTDFKGWARQPGLRTVEDEIEKAMVVALRIAAIRVTCAGRTDAGVHARGQVLHADVDPQTLVTSAGRSLDPPLDALARRMNGLLPQDVRVRRISEAPDGFDARYSAVWRRYVYRVADRPELVDPLRRSHVLTWDRALDLDLMNTAGQDLLGLNDFAAFCRAREGATTIRTLLGIEWIRGASGLAELTVLADAFCHSMVRSLTGCLMSIGDGRHPREWAKHLLDEGLRHPGLRVASARGLTLEEVSYPDGIELIRQSERARHRRELPDE